MGIPIWEPKNDQLAECKRQQQLQQQHCKRHALPKPHHPSPPHANYRLYRREQPTTTTTSSFPYYLASDYHQPMLHPLTTEQAQYNHHSYLLLTSRAADQQQQQQQQQQQMEQRLNEKQELLDQLNITISLLDQFLSIRDLSGQENAALPPFITDDLLAILSATSATLISNHTSSYDHQHQYRGGPSSSTRSITTTTTNSSSSSLSSRLADLESSILSAHHRVSDRLNLLGAILPVPSPR